MKNLINVSILFLCFNSSFAQTPNWEWIKSTKINSPFAGKISSDKAGNIYLACSTQDSLLRIGDTIVKSMGGLDLLLVKYSPAGEVVWVRHIGGSKPEYCLAVKTDKEDNTYITGRFTSPVLSFGTTNLKNEGSGDVFIAKYKTDGSLLWARSFGGANSEEPYALAFDYNNNVILTGSFKSDTLKVASNILIKYKESDFGGAKGDAFVIKYDAFGNTIWAKSFGGNNRDVAAGVHTDKQNNILIIGSFSSYFIKVGADTLYNLNKDYYDKDFLSDDIFIIKLDQNGKLLWFKIEGGPKKSDDGKDICIDINGNIYVIGTSYNDSLKLGKETYYNESGGGGCIGFLAKYDDKGNLQWSKGFLGGLGFSSTPSHITTDKAGDVYLAGNFYSEIYIDTTLYFGRNGDPNAFVVKYNSSGRRIWSDASSAGNLTFANNFALTNLGTYLVMNSFNNQVNFSKTTYTNPDLTTKTSHIFLAKIGESLTGLQPNNIIQQEDILFPNPATETIQLYFNGNTGILNLYSLSGVQITNIEVKNGFSKIDISKYSKGTYYYSLTKESVVVKKGTLIFK